VLLGQKVNVLIMEKALTLDLVNFEDSEFYDKMTRGRREASIRPLSLVNSTFSLLQNTLIGDLRWSAAAILRLGSGCPHGGSCACLPKLALRGRLSAYSAGEPRKRGSKII
jgi:hypothetical protein